MSSTPFMLLSISLFVVYTVNLLVVRSWSCRVTYYFDTSTFGRRHQLFGRVTKLDDKSKKIIFVDCKQKSNGYKVYNPNKKKR
jgi:hypothetical protein